jgi:hypothetical protein
MRQSAFTLMADLRIDALVYATFEHLSGIIADDVMTQTVVPDTAGDLTLQSVCRLSPAERQGSDQG